MKKILIALGILSFIFLGTTVLGTVVTERKINRPQTSQTQKSTYRTGISKDYKLAENIRVCKPYRETLSTDYLGMKFSYSLEILGWVNNKCRLDFEAKTDGAYSNFEEIYGVSPDDASQIMVFAPKIRCEFSKNQLDFVGDSILQEKERAAQNSSMLKDPKNISFSGISPSDMKLLDVIFRQKACNVLNTQDFNDVINGLLGY